jgi:hypothetical protein
LRFQRLCLNWNQTMIAQKCELDPELASMAVRFERLCDEFGM